MMTANDLYTKYPDMKNVPVQADIFARVFDLTTQKIPTKAELTDLAIEYVMGHSELQLWTVAQVEQFIKILESLITVSQPRGGH